MHFSTPDTKISGFTGERFYDLKLPKSLRFKFLCHFKCMQMNSLLIIICFRTFYRVDVSGSAACVAESIENISELVWFVHK